jgi:hypothetical protein
MLVTRISAFTGKSNIKDLPITQFQMEKFESKTDYVNNIFFNLSPEDKQFIQTGVTKEEWAEVLEKEEVYTY